MMGWFTALGFDGEDARIVIGMVVLGALIGGGVLFTALILALVVRIFEVVA